MSDCFTTTNCRLISSMHIWDILEHLAALTAVIVIFCIFAPSILGRTAPPVPTSIRRGAEVIEVIQKLNPMNKPVAEIGVGFTPVTRKLTDTPRLWCELNVVPYLFIKALSRISLPKADRPAICLGNALGVDAETGEALWAGGYIVYFYQGTHFAEKFLDLWRSQINTQWVVTNAFPLPGLEPHKVIHGTRGIDGDLYVYHRDCLEA
jgi:hypothetical protein